VFSLIFEDLDPNANANDIRLFRVNSEAKNGLSRFLRDNLQWFYREKGIDRSYLRVYSLVYARNSKPVLRPCESGACAFLMRNSFVDCDTDQILRSNNNRCGFRREMCKYWFFHCAVDQSTQPSWSVCLKKKKKKKKESGEAD